MTLCAFSTLAYLQHATAKVKRMRRAGRTHRKSQSRRHASILGTTRSALFSCIAIPSFHQYRSRSAKEVE